MNERFLGFRALTIQALDLGVIHSLTIYVDGMISYQFEHNQSELRSCLSDWFEDGSTMFEKTLDLSEELVTCMFKRKVAVLDEV